MLKIWISCAAVSAIVVGLGVSYLLNQSVVRDSELYGTMYFRSVVMDGSPDEEGVMSRIAQESKSGYRTLAKIRLASDKLQSGDKLIAIAMYKDLIADRSTDKFFVDYASYALLMLYADAKDYVNMDKLSSKIKWSSFKPYAREVVAMASLDRGDTSNAAALFQEIIDDVNTPPDVRRRVTEIRGYLD